MKCKNKEFKIKGFEYNDILRQMRVREFNVICTNDENGKTLSIDDGMRQFTIPFEHIAKCFEGDYRKG